MGPATGAGDAAVPRVREPHSMCGGNNSETKVSLARAPALMCGGYFFLKCSCGNPGPPGACPLLERTCIMQNANLPESRFSGDCSTIVTFQADWHHELGPKLAVFPRSIPLLGEVFWPDLASLVEDRQSRQMMYYPQAPSTWSVQVTFYQQQGSWNLAVFRDACLVAQCPGDSLASLSQELAQKLK